MFLLASGIVFILGLLVMALGIASFFIQPYLRVIFGNASLWISIITTLVGITMMVGISAIYALFQTTTGTVAFLGGLFVLGFALVLFWNPGKKGGKKR